MMVDCKQFAAIVQEYSEPLYWHIRRLVVSHEDAQDILQETFVKAYRNIWKLRDREALKCWMYRIATNEAMRFLGKRKNDEQLSEELADKLSASDYVDYTREAEVKLQKAILTLPQQQRAVFCLKYYDEMDYGQIADVLGGKPETHKVNYHYAKEKVKRYLEEN